MNRLWIVRYTSASDIASISPVNSGKQCAILKLQTYTEKDLRQTYNILHTYRERFTTKIQLHSRILVIAGVKRSYTNALAASFFHADKLDIRA